MPHDARVAIFDGHNDAVQHLAEYRPGCPDFLAGSEQGHLDLPRARRGGMAGGLFALFAKPGQPPQNDFTRTADGYEVRLADPLDPAYAAERIQAQLAALSHVVARSAGAIRRATTVAEIEAARRDDAFAMVLHMEGAEAIGPDLAALGELYAAGLRSLGLVWSRPNIFGVGVPFGFPRSPDTGPGLTPLVIELVRACNRSGIMLDLSHLNERGFWDVARVSTAPLVATHAGAHAVCRSTRNLTDRQLDAIRDSRGIVGFNFSVCDVRPDAHLDPNTPMDVIVRHLRYLIERLGEDCVGLGSDFDGAVMPSPLKDAACLQDLVAALHAAGFGAGTLGKIAFDNWMRVFRLSWYCPPPAPSQGRVAAAAATIS